jgi:hypothetical protein
MADSEPDKIEKNAPDAPKEDSSKEKLQQHHVSKILDQVLEETAAVEPTQKYRHPILVDIVLAVGLLIAMAGFTAGLFRMYVAHSAEQSITKGNFQAAIAILEGAPFPNVFAAPGSEPRELLDQALYLDAMEKLNAYSEDQAGLKELEKIEPGSAFFELAQTILKEHFKPSAITLEGGATEEEHISEEEAQRRSQAAQPSSEANP